MTDSPMKEGSLKQIASLIGSNWWILLIRGILLVILGLYALFNPGLSLLAWALVTGVFLMADGILALIAGIAGWAGSRGWTIVRGIIGILVGLVAVAHPALFGGIAGLTVIIILAAYAIAGGVMEIIVAIRERKAIEGEGWMILSGVFSILFGIALLLAPLLSLDLFIRVAGSFAIFFGIVAIFASFKFRKLKDLSSSETPGKVVDTTATVETPTTEAENEKPSA